MPQYRVKMIVNDRSTYVVVSAYSAGDAARLARAQFTDNNVRVLETSRIR
jgi:hypothetical protein